ncbi:hypothetical protein OROGR_029027 [Orobanche gracilis]
MAVITRRLLRTWPVHNRNRYPLHHFSSSPDNEPPSESKPESESQSQSSFSSYLTDVKASLRREPAPQNRPQTLRKPLSFSNPPPPLPPTPPPSRVAYLDEIRRNLSEYRSRSAPSPPSSDSGMSPLSSAPGQSVSLQELYKRHATLNNEDSTLVKQPIGASLAPIRDTLRHIRPANNQSASQGKTYGELSLARFKESLELKPGAKADQGSSILGGNGSLPPFFQKELNKIEDKNVGNTAAMRTQFVRTYSYSQLGEKLKLLRPEKKKGNWFSLHELNERLAKLRQIEQESPEEIGGVTYADLRGIVSKLAQDDVEKKKTPQGLSILNQIGGTPDFMLSPPQDHLVEKYFHPDNMSSAEKLKLELKKVRDEFKMSESDCGSARVQVAQLTTKIEHLSNVLHKKDKHSQRGKQAMVDRRKKLLKYLRRTDWDSYCIVLSKLGLRDNVENIVKAYPNKKAKKAKKGKKVRSS